jgi:hypothetical protein
MKLGVDSILADSLGQRQHAPLVLRRVVTEADEIFGGSGALLPRSGYFRI